MNGSRRMVIATALVGTVGVALVVGLGVERLRPAGHASAPVRPSPTVSATASVPAAPAPTPPFPVGRRTIMVVDRSRLIAPPHSGSETSQPRRILTTVWYPSTADGGPFPLVVFGPGFDLFPARYAPLLRAWARSGYVVAAPAFPLTNPSTPGGPDEADLPNQPRDVEAVISSLARRNRTAGSFLFARLDLSRVAVAGHSDGGDTALAVAYQSCCRDTRIRAAIVLSGALLPVGGGWSSPPAGPPLLAVQGSADTVNRPQVTRAYFQDAPTPKFLLWLRGADHLSPYFGTGRYEQLVARVTIAFLDRYLKGLPVRHLMPAGARELASLVAVLQPRTG